MAFRGLNSGTRFIGVAMQIPVLLCIAASAALSSDPPIAAPPAVGAKVANFTAKNVNGPRQSLDDFRDKKAFVIVFIGTECPIANLYLTTLAEMHEKYAAKGVQFLVINSNDHDKFDEVVAHAQERNVPFPVLKDLEHDGANALGARRTPEAFLLDADKTIRYHGRVDDQYGYSYRRPSPNKTELKDAIDALLAGKPITITESDVQGCIIGRSRKKTAAPSK